MILKGESAAGSSAGWVERDLSYDRLWTFSSSKNITTDMKVVQMDDTNRAMERQRVIRWQKFRLYKLTTPKTAMGRWQRTSDSDLSTIWQRLQQPRRQIFCQNWTTGKPKSDKWLKIESLQPSEVYHMWHSHLYLEEKIMDSSLHMKFKINSSAEFPLNNLQIFTCIIQKTGTDYSKLNQMTKASLASRSNNDRI